MDDDEPKVELGTARLSDVQSKKVGSVKQHSIGVVYLPGEWIGSEVIVVRRRKK